MTLEPPLLFPILTLSALAAGPVSSPAEYKGKPCGSSPTADGLNLESVTLEKKATP